MTPTRATQVLLMTGLLTIGTLAGCLEIFERVEGCPQDVRQPGEGEKAYQGWELKVLTHGAWSWTYDAVKDGFENRTGARLTEIAAEDAGGALREATANRGNPVADVVWGLDNALLHKARQADILQPYTSPNAHRILDSIPVDQFKTEDGTFLATPADHGFIAVNYDISLRVNGSDSAPSTLRDLATPKWASEFVTQDPRTSSPGLGFLIATVATFGQEGDYTWQDYWRDLFENGVLITDGWTEAYTYHYSANGFGTEGAPMDRSIVTSYTTSPAAEVYYGSFETANAESLEPPQGVFHQIETVAILKCTRNLHLAREFVDYVLTEEFQRTIPDTQAIYPIIEGVPMPQTYQDIATDPGSLAPAEFTAQELGEHLDGWVAQWRTLFQEHYA